MGGDTVETTPAAPDAPPQPTTPAAPEAPPQPTTPAAPDAPPQRTMPAAPEAPPLPEVGGDAVEMPVGMEGLNMAHILKSTLCSASI